MAIITASDKRKAAKMGIPPEEYVAMKAAEAGVEKEARREEARVLAEAERAKKEALARAEAEAKAEKLRLLAEAKAAEEAAALLLLKKEQQRLQAEAAARSVFEKMTLAALREHLLRLSSIESERLEKDLKKECWWLVSAGICSNISDALVRKTDEFRRNFIRAILRLETQKKGLIKMDVEVHYKKVSEYRDNGRNSDELYESWSVWCDVYTIFVNGVKVDEYNRQQSSQGRWVPKLETIAIWVSKYDYPKKINSLDDIDFYLCGKGEAFYIPAQDGDVIKLTVFVNPNTRIWDLDDF